MRIYEELYILKPDVTEEEADASIDMIRQIITTSGGTIDKVDKWGIRRLAFRVAKRSEGFYILIQFSSGPDTVKEIERRLRVLDTVIKYITVRIDEKLKWLEKRKKIREKRAAKRPPPPPPQSMPSAPGPGAPGAPGPAMPGAPAHSSPGAAPSAAPGAAPAAPLPAAAHPAAPAPASAPAPAAAAPPAPAATPAPVAVGTEVPAGKE